MCRCVEAFLYVWFRTHRLVATRSPMETQQWLQIKRPLQHWLPHWNQRPRNLPNDVLERDLDRALRSGGCPLCWLALEYAGQTMRSYLAEHSQDVQVQREMLATWGACASHAWALGRLEQQRYRAVFMLALSYEDLLKHLCHFWQEERRVPAPPAIGGTCRFCQRARWLDTVFAERLVLRLMRPAAPPVPNAIPNLCLPHLGSVTRLLKWPQRSFIARFGDEERLLGVQVLVESAAKQLTSLLQKEAFAVEEVRRLVALLVGERIALPAAQDVGNSDETSLPFQAEQQHDLTGGGARPGRSLSLGCMLCDRAAQQSQQVLVHLLIAVPTSEAGGTEPLQPPSAPAWCHSHSWLAHDLWRTQQADAPASALPAIFRRSAEWALEALTRHSLPTPSRACPACRAGEESARLALPMVLGTHWQPPHLLCLEHWRLAWNALLSQRASAGGRRKQAIWTGVRAIFHKHLIRGGGAGELPQELPAWVSTQEAALRELSKGLAAYMRRFDAYQRTAGRGPQGWEERAWEVVLACFVGNEPIQYPTRLLGRSPTGGKAEPHV